MKTERMFDFDAQFQTPFEKYFWLLKISFPRALNPGSLLHAVALMYKKASPV